MGYKLKYRINRIVLEWESNPDPTFEEFMAWNQEAYAILKELNRIIEFLKD